MWQGTGQQSSQARNHEQQQELLVITTRVSLLTAASAGSKQAPSPVEVFLGAHPAALAFVQTPKPTPSSFAKEVYFGVTAFRFTNGDGLSRYGRYRIIPEAGVDHLDGAATNGRNPNFLFDELAKRITAGPVRFEIQVQVAYESDVVDDATIHWPADRPLIQLGSLVLNEVAPDNQDGQKRIIFDPIPRVDGIEPSDDPLLELRAAIYLLSGRRRRQAPN